MRIIVKLVRIKIFTNSLQYKNANITSVVSAVPLEVNFKPLSTDI